MQNHRAREYPMLALSMLVKIEIRRYQDCNQGMVYFIKFERHIRSPRVPQQQSCNSQLFHLCEQITSETDCLPCQI